MYLWTRLPIDIGLTDELNLPSDIMWPTGSAGPTPTLISDAPQQQTKKKSLQSQTHYRPFHHIYLEIENLFKLGVVGFPLHLRLLCVRPVRGTEAASVGQCG